MFANKLMNMSHRLYVQQAITEPLNRCPITQMIGGLNENVPVDKTSVAGKIVISGDGQESDVTLCVKRERGNHFSLSPRYSARPSGADVKTIDPKQ